jgi:hypothetical protein
MSTGGFAPEVGKDETNRAVLVAVETDFRQRSVTDVVEAVRPAIACRLASVPGMAFVAAYQPRDPEASPLYRVVAGHLETFLARQRERERHVPAFVENEFRCFLNCGLLCRGFLRVHCRDCGLDRLVPFSCKGRAFCPSCGGRRMADTAAHLVDRVFPVVPVRQWVLSLPFALRYRLAYDPELVTAVLHIFADTVLGSLTRRAVEFDAVRHAQGGAVTFIQRSGGSLNLNLHFHMLALDGVYAADDQDQPQFQPLMAPENDEIARLTASLAERIPALLQRRGMGAEADPEESDSLRRDEPWLAGLYAASISGRVAYGPNAGRRVTRTGDQIDAESLDALASPRCATVSGFSLHANVAVPARDRQRLEQLVRYCARPPLAIERLQPLADGRLLYRFKRPWRDGTTHIVLAPLELLEKLAAMVPRPKTHLVRYHGVLAPAAKWRASIVPTAAAPPNGESDSVSRHACRPAILTSNKPRNRGPVPPHRRLRLLPSSRTSVITPGRS